MHSRAIGFGLALLATSFALSAEAGNRGAAAVAVTGEPSASASGTTRQAVYEFVEAYVNHDSSLLTQATTEDFEIQYGLAGTGTHLSVDEDALAASWRDSGTNATAYDVRSVRIFPTANDRVVFVTYRISGDDASDRILLVELRGDRIARARDLVRPAPEFKEPTGSKNDAQSLARAVLVGHPDDESVYGANPTASRSTSRPRIDVRQQAADVLAGISPQIGQCSSAAQITRPAIVADQRK
jgi:hypothetical protein